MKNYSYGQSGRTTSQQNSLLSYDIEFSVLRVIQKQIESCREVEEMRQELVTTHDWSGLAAFRIIDEYSHGNVNNDK
jgi:hypothetical protein